MSERMELYKEILELDPCSRVFFLFAQLLEKEGKVDEALEVLARGLDRQPDYLEARLYYIELLAKNSRVESAELQLQKFSELLKKYPSFWQTWSQMSAAGNVQVSAVLGLLSLFFSQPNLSFMQVLQAGIETFGGAKAFSASTDFSSSFVAPSPVVTKELEQIFSHESASSAFLSEENENLKASTITRSMADLLVEQGDISGAIKIYSELIAKAESKGNKQLGEELSTRLNYLKEHAQLPEVESKKLSSLEKNDIEKTGQQEENISPRMISMLEKLAARLEKRAQPL